MNQNPLLIALLVAAGSWFVWLWVRDYRTGMSLA